jgi:uncharacterized delta-60 repeat protein
MNIYNFMHRSIKFQITFIFALSTLIGYAQPGSIDTTFNITDVGSGAGPDFDILTTSIQNDGKIIIGGNFTSYDESFRLRIARLNTDGSLDTSFNPGTGADLSISTTTIQSDGKIIIGGDFTSYNGIAINRIARLNMDGSLDTSFNSGTGAISGVRIISIQSDGKIIIGGDFTSYNGTARSRIARLNTDGSLDTTFNSGTGPNSVLRAISIQSDGKIIIGGTFTSYNGTARNRIARLNTDGSLDVSFNPGTGVNNQLYTLSIQSDGKILIGGDFTSYNGTGRNRIARLNTDGSLDASFNIGTGASSFVLSTSLQGDGKIIIGGNFISFNGTARNRIARLNADGSLDASFNIGTGASSFVYSTSLQGDGKIIICGIFFSYNGTDRNGIARINTDGSLDTNFNPGTGANGIVQTISIQSDGKILIGGDFTSYNGTGRNGIARLNTDGSLDASFNIGTGASSFVYSTSLQGDGKIIIGGNFFSFNGTARNRIARLNADGSLDASFNPGTGANDVVQAISIQSDGKIIIGGVFTRFNGTVRNRITRLNTDGSLETSFNPGTGANGEVRAICIQSDGKSIIVGSFRFYNGTGRNRIARLHTDGSLDGSFNPGIGANNGVFTISIQSDGKFIIGGNFTSYNGTRKNRVTRILSVCNAPTVPTLTATSLVNCGVKSNTLSIASGNLNNATNWQWYIGSCGGNSAGTGASVSVDPLTTTTYYARGEGGCVTPSSCGIITITVNPVPTTPIIGGVSDFCPSSLATLNTGSYSGYQWSTGATTPAITVNTAGPYTVTVSNEFGCTDTASTLLAPCFLTLNLKAYLQGFYTGNGLMNAVLDPVNQPTTCDSIMVELHRSVAPFDVIFSLSGIISTSGTGTFPFAGSVYGSSYYIVVKHRNSLESWSKNPVLFDTSNVGYDFSVP